MPKKLSIIISAFNRHKLTQAHVRQCMESTLLPDEIIVVNDHGDPCLRDMLKELEIKTKLIYAYIQEDIPWNYTGARNLGVWLSRGEFIVSEDNDNIPSKTLYESLHKHLQDNPDVGLVLAGGRPAISVEDMNKYPSEEWDKHIQYNRPAHDDSFMMRKKDYIRMKGYNEEFAGAYAWVCTDWTRRLIRAEIKVDRIKTDKYYVAVGEGTRVCECNKSREERAKQPVCPDCGLAYKRRSYRNYGLARGKTYIQPPKGILNFTYTTECL